MASLPFITTWWPCLALALDELEGLQHVAQRVIVAGLESGQGVVQHAGILAAEPLADERLELGDVQVEDAGHQAQRKDVLALILGRAADRLDGQIGNRHPDMMIIAAATPALGSTWSES